ncbi:MAG TPA: STAS domain-containing protein [Candidatus Cybelea sp.]
MELNKERVEGNAERGLLVGMADAQDSRKRLIKLDGEYDFTRKDELAGLFGSIDGESSVVIDMASVTYMDATFLRELRMLRLRGQARSITLAGANKHIRRVLKIVNFDKLFNLTE